jgi:aminoglycoside phosphotransferase (APT) family kinase protein
MSDVIVAPETRDLDELATTLTTWMADRLPAANGLVLHNFDYPRGAGQSHETILFDARWQQDGQAHSQGYVVRIRPGHFTVFPDTLFEEQFQVMRVLHAGGYVKVAEPLWLERDPTVLGKPFFVMKKIAGKVPVSIPPYAETGWVAEATAEQRRRMWDGAVRQLAAVQHVPLDELRFLEGPPHARAGLAQEWDKYVRFVAWLEGDGAAPGFIRILRRGLERLRAHWPTHQPEGLVWGDARMGNMMFDAHFDVVAVMDWEQPSLGGALHDLAWFTVICETMHGARADRPALAGMGTRAETIALWEEISGKSAQGLEWYEEFAKLKMSCTGVRLGLLRGVDMMDEATMAQRLQVAAGA